MQWFNQNNLIVMEKERSYCCVGLMSGTSCDGLDMVLCDIFYKDGKWNYELLKSTTVAYDEVWEQRLRSARTLSGYDLIDLHRQFGELIGTQVKIFVAGEKPVDFISSHGHTVFHEPYNNLSLQIGDGATIAAYSGINTVSDFRTLDIALGGQGAPLVPIGDHFLFSEYVACVNLGGFANISMQKGNERIAWDICPVNFIANKLMKSVQLFYDDKGAIGRDGHVISGLLNELEQLPYYYESAPKSLGEEWVANHFEPILKSYKVSLSDLLRTCYEHFSLRIASDVSQAMSGRVLFTGGGVYNEFLMELIKEKVDLEVVNPGDELIEYKEALIFAFLGVLRWEEQINCLSSVTGARMDNCSGVINLVK